MQTSGTRERVATAMSSSATWRTLLGLYLAVVLFVMSPVLLTSVGADDSYWILEGPGLHGGSFWQAFWQPVETVFAFEGQPRSTALAFAERRVLALATLEIARLLAAPPLVVWALVKLGLLAIALGTVAVFLRTLRFRGRDGAVRGLQPATIVFVLLALPLAIALGVKSQNVASLNGWNFYPTLTYGAFPFCMGFAALALRASVLLQRSYRVWVVPVVVAALASGVILNLSYELVAVCVPLTLFVLLLQPLPDEPTFVRRWRAKVTVGGAVAVGYTVFFAWIRWRISRMACNVDGSCYSGSVVEVDPRTLVRNFLGALPGGTSELVSGEAASAGRPYPGPDLTSVSLGLLGVLLLAAAWVSWSARHRARQGVVPADERGHDLRGLLVVGLVALAIAVGTTVISGISARAVEMLETPVVAYRTNVVVWTSLALAGVAALRAATLVRWRVVGVVALGLAAVVVVAGIGLYFPRNLESGLANRLDTRLVDTIHREVTLGDLSEEGDARRCMSVETVREDIDPSSRFARTINGAYGSFDYFYGEPYCSTFSRFTGVRSDDDDD